MAYFTGLFGQPKVAFRGTPRSFFSRFLKYESVSAGSVLSQTSLAFHYPCRSKNMTKNVGKVIENSIQI
jgi:hypothetical protein